MSESQQIYYDAARDRLIGADTFGNFQGRPVKTIHLSMSRAMALKDCLHLLDATYNKHVGNYDADPAPYPKTIAILGAGLDLGDYAARLPAEYQELGQLIALVPAQTNLDRERPGTNPEREHFATQLFCLLRIMHKRAHFVLNQGGGTSLETQYVSARGEFTDLYFMAPLAALSEQERYDRCARDLANAVGLLWHVTGALPIDAEKLFAAAVSTYLDSSQISAAMQSNIEKAVDALALGSLDSAKPSLRNIADAIQRE